MTLVREIGEIARFQTQHQNSITFLNNSVLAEKELTILVPFTINTKIKYIVLNFPKGVKDLYNKKMTVKETKEGTKKLETPCTLR